MGVVATSRWAYERVSVNERQAEVLAALRALGGEASDQDIAGKLGWPINRVTPRRGELVEAGLVQRARLVVGPTRRKVSLWALVPVQLPLFGAEQSRPVTGVSR